LGTRLSTLTQQEEAAGLLADPATIGTRTAWLSRLQEKGLDKVRCPIAFSAQIPSSRAF